LTPDEIKAISAGELSFDARVRCYIREHFGYRWIAVADAITARKLERAVRTASYRQACPSSTRSVVLLCRFRQTDTAGRRRLQVSVALEASPGFQRLLVAVFLGRG
jgi:hypothetical protein